MSAFRTVLSIALFAAAPAAPAAEPCREGATADGRCVRPQLAQSMRQQAVWLTQPRLSYSAPPLPPDRDAGGRTLRPGFEAQQFSAPYHTRLPRR